MATRKFLASVAALAAFGPVPLHAQSVTLGQGVADRARLDYDPVGLRAGAFQIFPSAVIAGDVTDNYSATNTNRQSEAYLTVSPEIFIRSDWAVHGVQAKANYSRNFHAELPYEDVSTYGASVSGRLDISRQSIIKVDAEHNRSVESRAALGTIRGNRDPVLINTSGITISGVQQFNLLRLDAAAGLRKTDFRDVTDFSGAVIDQDYRDSTTRFVSGGVSYRLSPGIALVVNSRFDKITYDFRPGSPGFDPVALLDRRSKGYTVRGGLGFQLSSLIFGGIEVGYLNRDYRDIRLKDVNGLSYSGNILWNVTRLTSIRLKAERTVQETSTRDTAGNLVDSFSVGVDHELLRYLILSADTEYSASEPNGPGFDTDFFSIGIGARYLVNRRFQINAYLRHAERDSDNPLFRYRSNGATISTRVAF